MPSKVVTDREFSACIHPLQGRRFALALVFALLLAPVAVALVFLTFFVLAVIIAALVFMAWFGMRVWFAYLVGNMILVSPLNYPRIDAILTEIKEALGYQKPVFVFVYENPSFNIFVAKLFHRDAIYLNSELLESGVNDDEIRWLIGRFVGYLRVRQRAGVWGWLIRMTQKVGIFNLFILPYERAMVYTGDRLALAVIGGDLSTAVSVMQKLMVGRQLGYSVNPQGIAEQYRQVRGTFFAFVARLGSAHPHVVARYIDLIVFAKSVFPSQYAQFEASNPDLPQDIAKLAPRVTDTASDAMAQPAIPSATRPQAGNEASMFPRAPRRLEKPERGKAPEQEQRHVMMVAGQAGREAKQATPSTVGSDDWWNEDAATSRAEGSPLVTKPLGSPAPQPPAGIGKKERWDT